MPIDFHYRVKYQDLSVDDLVLKADVNEGYEILDVGFISGGTDVVAEFKINEETYLNVPIHYQFNLLMPQRMKGTNQNMFFEMVREQYTDVPTIKISEGERYIITTGKQTGQVFVTYKQYSGRDIPMSTDTGGKESDNRILISHGKGEVTISPDTTTEFYIDTSLNKIGVTKFPFEENASHKYNWNILGWCLTKGNGTGADIEIHGVQFWYREKSILAANREYVDIDLYPYPLVNTDNRIFFIDTPITFVPEETLQIRVKAKNTNTTTAQTARVDCTFIIHQTTR